MYRSSNADSSAMQPCMQPLSGLLVLDFTHAAAGSARDADAGGSGRRGDQDRAAGRRGHARATRRASTARARRSRCSTAARRAWCSTSRTQRTAQRLMPLIKRADVLVEQFRPGRDGAARPRLRRRCARSIRGIVYCSITGYGQSGPRAGEAGHDINYIGAHRPARAAARAARPPGRAAGARSPTSAAARMPAVINILLGAAPARRTGQGCHIDIAMADAMFTFAWHALAVGHATGRFPGAGDAAAGRRLAALPALPDRGRQARRLRRAGAEILARVLRRDRACRRR